MTDNRKAERRSGIERRKEICRRVKEEEWLPPYGSRKYDATDRRCNDRRISGRRESDQC